MNFISIDRRAKAAEISQIYIFFDCILNDGLFEPAQHVSDVYDLGFAIPTPIQRVDF